MAASSASLRNRLKLRQLALLAELDAAGSLHKAADRLGMSQPAATRLVQELEQLIGASLFERTSRGMTPTDMGRLLMRHASMVLVGVDHIGQEAAALRSGNAGTLRVGMFPGVPPKLVAAAVIGLKRETPRMEIRLIQSDNETLLDDLRDGRLDVVVGRGPASSAKKELDFELLYDEHFCVVTSQAIAESTESCRFEHLIDHAWVLPLPNTALRSNLELLFLSQCGRLPVDFVEAVSSPVVVALITKGNRVATMPSWIAREHESSGRMRILIARLADITGPIGLITRSGEALSSQANRMAEALRASRQHVDGSPTDSKTGSRPPNH